MSTCFYTRTEPKNSLDYFATPPKAVRALLKHVEFRSNIIEPCCGEGHISETLKSAGYYVESSDIVYRGYGKVGSYDFLNFTEEQFADSDIVTNPPFVRAQEFIEYALKHSDKKAKVAMLLRLSFLESQKRKALFNKYPLTAVYIFRSRIGCAKNGAFKLDSKGEENYPSAVAYAWFLWDKSYFEKPAPPNIFWLE